MIILIGLIMTAFVTVPLVLAFMYLARAQRKAKRNVRK